MHWSEPFLGLPHVPLGRSPAGVDCWGLVHLVYAAHGRLLPSYAGDYASIEERAEIAALIGSAKVSSAWRQVDAPEPLDVLTFRHGKSDGHVGIVVRPGRMLHAMQGKLSCIEDYTLPRWACRLTGIWRYAAH